METMQSHALSGASESQSTIMCATPSSTLQLRQLNPLLVDNIGHLLVNLHICLLVQHHIISMTTVNFMITSTTITTSTYQN